MKQENYVSYQIYSIQNTYFTGELLLQRTVHGRHSAKMVPGISLRGTGMYKLYALVHTKTET